MSTDEIEQALAGLRITDNKSDKSTRTKDLGRIAGASREDEQVRLKLAEPAILATLTDMVEKQSSEDVETTQLALRCIGNASIDNSDARDVLAGKSWNWAIKSLRSTDPVIQKLTLKVLYNACAEHEEAQRQCFREHLHYDLLELRSNTELELDDDETGLFAELLFWITGHKASLEPELPAPLPETVIRNLLTLPHSYTSSVSNLDDFATVIESCLIFIRDAAVQAQVIDLRLVEKIGQAFLDIESYITAQTDDGSEESKENLQLLLPLSTSMLWCLSDISANLIFFSKYDFSDPWIEALLNCIGNLASTEIADPRPDSTWPLVSLPEGDRPATVACQVIGNLFWASPAESWQDVVVEKSIHHHLFSAIHASESLELLHAANGLLIQISRPSVKMRQMIGADDLAPAAIGKLCHHEKAEMRQDGMKLLGALARDCLDNQTKFAGFAREIIRTSPPPTINSDDE